VEFDDLPSFSSAFAFCPRRANRLTVNFALVIRCGLPETISFQLYVLGIFPYFSFINFNFSLEFFPFLGVSNSGSGRRASRASQDNGPPPQGQMPILGVDFVISDVTLRSEVHQAQAILDSLNSRISDAKAQLQEYGERMEGLGNFLFQSIFVLFPRIFSSIFFINFSNFFAFHAAILAFGEFLSFSPFFPLIFGINFYLSASFCRVVFRPSGCSVSVP
jgi:hypothetical protein